MDLDGDVEDNNKGGGLFVFTKDKSDVVVADGDSFEGELGGLDAIHANEALSGSFSFFFFFLFSTFNQFSSSNRVFFLLFLTFSSSFAG